MINVLLRHPETTFVGVHFGNNPENIRYVAAVLDRFPNFNIDTAARVGEIGRVEPASLHQFFIKYQDRTLFGSDVVYGPDNVDLGVPMPGTNTNEEAKKFFNTHWKFFETTARNMDHPSPSFSSATIIFSRLSCCAVARGHSDSSEAIKN